MLAENRIDSAPNEAEATKQTSRIVARNVLWFVGAQLLNMPLSLLLNGILARGLGALEYGTLYLVTTLIGFATVVGEMGQSAALPSAVARDRNNASRFVGAAVSLRVCTGVVAHAVLTACVLALGYDRSFYIPLALMTAQAFLGHLGGSATAAARGLERGDLVARNALIGQVLNAVAVIPTVLLGGKLVAILAAQLAATVITTAIDWRLLKTLDIGCTWPERPLMKAVFAEGLGFLFLSLILVLQPNVDAIMLSKLSSETVIGWHAVARRLMGFLVFPASAVTSALYPSLCRLRVESPNAMAQTARASLEIVGFLGIPLSLGCVFYPDIGIAIFSRTSFGPAEDNVRFLAPFVLLVYLSMILGTYVTALGRQRAWAIAQLACVAVSAGLNPILVPRFQEMRGNGGLGVCISTVVSEVLMVVAGWLLAPRGLTNRAFLRSFVLALLSGAVMGLAAWGMRPIITPWVAAPISVACYFGVLRLTGALRNEHLAFFRGILNRRRQAAAAPQAAA